MAPHHPTDSRASRQILVVDDDPSIRLLCVTSLTKAGYQVLQAEGSSEAMALYSNTSTGPIDLLLTDLFLPPPGFEILSRGSQYPRVNGNDLVQQVLSVKKELRVLLMSSHALSHLASQGIMIEPERFLPKPFDVEYLLTRVAAALAAPPIARASHTAPVSGNGIEWVD